MSLQRWLLSTLFLLASIEVAATWSHADDFSRLEGGLLIDLAGGKGSIARERLTFGEIDAIPKVLGDSDQALIIVLTDRGNVAKLLISPALRKPNDPKGEPVPIVVVERFETVETPKGNVRLAKGRGVALFDGYQFDLDTGQVVPEGFGGDLVFQAKGQGLTGIHSAQIFTLDKTPKFPAASTRKLSPGKRVILSDFDGRYRLYANAQWSGMIDLKTDDKGVLTGEFRSDLNGQVYKVSGKAADSAPHRLTFSIEFPRSRQEYTGFLWTNGKGGIAGTFAFLDQTFGFFAVRDGFKPDPPDAEVP